MRAFKRILIFVSMTTVLALGLALIGCGGGGGSGSDTLQQGTIDTSNAPQIASTVMTINTGIDVAEFALFMNVGSGIYCPKTLLKHAEDLVFNGDNQLGDDYSSLKPAGYASETSFCPDGGSVTLNMIWDGPNDPLNCSEVQNPRIEFSFANCQSYSESMNGIMGMYYQGDLCSETPSSLSIYFTNFRYQNQIDNSDFTLNFSMELTNVQYDGNGFMVGMNILIDGYMNGTFQGAFYNINYDNYRLIFSDIKYSGTNEILEATVTLDGSFYGSINGDQFDESYDSLAISFQDTIVDSVQGELVTINGQYKGACLNGWITIQTIAPILFPDSSQCPTAGRVKFSGNGEATIVFHSDSSVTINVGGEELDYTTCDDLPSCI